MHVVGADMLIGSDPAIRAVREHVARVARLNVTVLLRGETGTGKEVCARALHAVSPRSQKPFVPFNCSAVPSDLLENELFGHESGAFTSASSQRHGLIRTAEAGTLFLDEIDGLPLASQVKLLRFLQFKQYRPLGTPHELTADVRIIAATNANLEDAVATGRVRADLYYRLNIFSITLPPLRERSIDIPTLANYFLDKYAQEFGIPSVTLNAAALAALCRYDWPGNIRELESVIQRAVALSTARVVTTQDLTLPASASSGEDSFRKAKAKAIRHFETTYIQGLLVAYQGNVTRAAAAAGKNRRALWQLIRKHDIPLEQFRRSRQK
jgi:DNA-binding NtrC family response regulator